MILAIQTIRPEIEVMLFDDKVNLLAGRNWLSAKDEVSRLLPEIEKLIAPNGGWKNISKIVVFNGIGGFSSTRIGVTVANTLAMAAKAQLYEISLPENQTENGAATAIIAARRVLRRSDRGNYNSGTSRISESPDMAAIVKKFFSGNPMPVKIAQPKYKSAPMISESKKKKYN